tara:strand:+ start:920 stop:1150 length:231 start_codon:yes stop_codon:yes gene_type:complete
MKRIYKKYKKWIHAVVFKKIVEYLQRPEVEGAVADVIAEKLPDKKGFGNKEQKAIAVVVIDKITDKVAVSLGLKAD